MPRILSLVAFATSTLALPSWNGSYPHNQPAPQLPGAVPQGYQHDQPPSPAAAPVPAPYSSSWSESTGPSPVAPEYAAITPAAAATQLTQWIQTTSHTTITVTVYPVPVESACPAPPPQSHAQSCQLPSAPLSNEQQVGHSTWGTLCQQTFPKWLPDGKGKPYESAPWGERTAQNSDGSVEEHIPVTNVTRKYEFTISRGTIAADGAVRDVILVNNQFPGPAIEANWGDDIQITVHNNITEPYEGTALHWHGFLQKGSNWEDGVSAVSQCPIAPGHSYTYTVPAQLYGTSWYHAHYSAQYAAGVLGPIIVYGPTQLPYDIDIGPVMLSDWYHIPYFSLVQDVVGTDLSKIPPTSDSLLINGRGRFDCSKPSYSSDVTLLSSDVSSKTPLTCTDGAELSKFSFKPGKTHRLRLMNVGADGVQKFSIDGHTMTVIAYDYVPVKAHTLNVITLAVGQRADILVTADSTTGNMFWMRTSATGGPDCGGSSQSEIQAAIYYEGADTNAVPTTTSSVVDVFGPCLGEPIAATQPEYSITPSSMTDAHQLDLVLGITQNASGNFQWLVNNQAYRANFNEPLLYDVANGTTSFPDHPEYNVYDTGNSRSVVLNVTNHTPVFHPFHLHGHNFYVLSVGNGGQVWDGSVVNPENPMRRDIEIIPPGGYIALMFESDNPGVWPFHCHVAWHLSGGLSANIITRADEIPAIPEGTREKTCVHWDWYSTHNTVDQIDAGS